MSTRFKLAIVLAAGTLLLSAVSKGGPLQAGPNRPRRPVTTQSVSILDFSFSPQSITIVTNDTVQWTNNGNATHDSSEDNGRWSSGNILPGGTFSQTFANGGTFTYHCAVHPFMTGSVSVNTPTPSPSPTDTLTPTATVTPTETATPTATPTRTLTPTPSNTPTRTLTPTPSNTPTPSPTPTNTSTSTATSTATPSNTPTRTLTPTPSNTPTPTPSPTPTRPRGDCNHDNAINSADVSSTVIEIFDGDGKAAIDVAGGSFAGDPIGCDSNADSIIDAGDLSCLIRIIFNQPGGCTP